MSEQPTLSPAPPTVGPNVPTRRMRRASDPETSHEGAKHIERHLNKLHKWTIECVRESPGLTQLELSRKYELTDPRKIGRRLSELADPTKGTPILRTEVVDRCSVSGRIAQRYYLVETST